MTGLADAVEQILTAQQLTKKPLAIVLAGHNGSGKSPMWRKRLSGQLQIPLVNADRMMLSILRVQTRVAEHGHDVPTERLLKRFPKTQRAIAAAARVADAAIFTDNSRDIKHAFTVCRVQLAKRQVFDLRQTAQSVPPAITEWLEMVAPFVA